MAEVSSFSRLEIACLEGRLQSVRFRQKSFHSLYNIIQTQSSNIKDAIAADTGHTEAEVTLEYALAISELRSHYDELNLEEDIKQQHSLENLKATTTNTGIVYLIPSKQNLFYSVISALTASLAAGNCVVVEVCLNCTHTHSTQTNLSTAPNDIDPSVGLAS